MNRIRNMGLVALALVTVTQSFAVGEFDVTTATAGFSTAAATGSVLVGSLVALGAGIMVYRKVAGYFSKAK